MTRSVALLLAALAVSACHPSRGGRAVAGPITVTHAVLPAPTSTAEASAFFVVANGGPVPAVLRGASSPAADSVRVHRFTGGLMEPAGAIEVPAGGSLRFAPGELHLMLQGLRRTLAVGDTVPVLLIFEPGGSLAVRMPVLNYTDAVSEIPLR
jgi:copper(I)-binding protein